MKAVVIDAYGGPETLKLVEVPDPQAGANEILVAVHASSVNPIDCKTRAGGLRLIRRLPMPTILGYDVSGEVIALGSGVTDFKVGDTIYARSGSAAGGAYAEKIALDVACVAKKPSSLSHAEAAAIPLAALTALQGIRDHGKLPPEGRVLVNGGSGGVGSYGVQVAKALGAHVTAVCSGKNMAFVSSLGADEVIDYKTQDPLQGNLPYDVIFDTVCTLPLGQAIKRLSKTGHYTTILPSVPVIFHQLFKNVFCARKVSVFGMHPSDKDLRLLATWADEGRLRSEIDTTYSLAEVADAHRQSEGGRTRGKIVIDVSGGEHHKA